MNVSTPTISDAIRQAFAGHSDARRLLRLATTRPEALLVEGLDGFEEVIPAVQGSAGFRLELRVICASAALSSDDWLGQPALAELLTAAAGNQRPFSGHVTAFESLGADGGFGYYRLTIEPWLAFLGQRRDSYVFHDMTVIEIVEAVFADYQGQASLAPAWRWALADVSVYRKRSVCTQYRESDLDFVLRLLAEEGLYAWFEHATGDSPTAANHTLVIADHMDAFTDNPQARIRFHRADATETEDSIQQLHPRRAAASHSVSIASWDYRSLDARLSTAAGQAEENLAGMPLTRFDAPGAYAWPDRETGERIARRIQESIDANRQTLTGSGTVRSLAPGSRFTLQGHFDADTPAPGDAADRDRYAVLRVEHHARNNFSASLGEQLSRLAGTLGESESAADTPLYANRFTLIATALPWRAPLADASGRLLRPRPTASGTQSAVVVGEAGQPVHSDRDGRIRLQFHWQRGARAHSRLAHPSSEDNAPADAGSWSWVQVMTQWTGANWGSHFTPRAGQEVLVAFIEGDIDRPVVIGALYNGQGAADAQGNRIASGAGAATGNAPAWFAGTRSAGSAQAGEGHAHRASLAGFKTQALSASQSGNGGFNQLVFDLTPQEPRAQLATTEHASRLNLGALRHQHDNQRLAWRGHGAELASAESGALRAGAGLLLSADARANASGMQMDASLAKNRLEAAKVLVTTLADSARKQKATLDGEAAPDKLAASEQLAHSAEIISATATHEASDAAGGSGTVPAWSAPMIVAESPAGIAALTPKDAILNAGATLSLTAQDIHLAAQGKSAWAVKDGIVLYTYGKASDGQRPVQDAGLKLHAAQGPVSVQAQSDRADLNADKALYLMSTTADALLQGKNELQLAAGGAAVQISGGNITLIAPGKVELKAGCKNFTEAKSVAADPNSLQGAAQLELMEYERLRLDEQFLLRDEHSGEILAGAPYRIEDAQGNLVAEGVTDASGHTQRVRSSRRNELRIYWGHQS